MYMIPTAPQQHFLRLNFLTFSSALLEPGAEVARYPQPIGDVGWMSWDSVKIYGKSMEHLWKTMEKGQI